MRALLLSDDLHLHVREDGDPDGRPVVFANSLGTDLRLWDAVLPHLPAGLRLIRYDMRGHGLSAVPPPPYAMEDLILDAAHVCEAFDVSDTLFIGLSIGGMVAQGLAQRRPDLVGAAVLSNTAPVIGTPALWADRIAQVGAGGTEALADAAMARWFSAEFRAGAEVELWRRMVAGTPDAGYAGCSAAIAETDLTDATAALSLPVLAIAGSEDGSTPPDLVRAMADSIPGASYALIEGAGHLPCVEMPAAYARLITEFLGTLGATG
ncbi:MAG: 3-oxoadipate enol-lactonase [Pseudomonadota bacterium]